MELNYGNILNIIIESESLGYHLDKDTTLIPR